MRPSRRSSFLGLMGLGANAAEEQAPIVVGDMARKDPIFSSAAVLASQVLIRMSLVPKSERLAEMRRLLNRLAPGAGDRAEREYLRLLQSKPANKQDQTMFDVVAAEIGNAIATKVLDARDAGGLGQTVAEARGGTSRSINDANAIFCTYVAGTSSIVGGFFSQLNIGGQGQNASPAQQSGIMQGAGQAGQIGGCGAGRLAMQLDAATQQSRIAQQGTVAQQALILQQQQLEAQRQDRFVRYALLGGGGLIAVIVLATLLKK